MPYCFLKTVELTVLLLIVWSCTVCCFLPRSVCIRQIVRQRQSILHESERPTQIFVGRLPLNISEQRLVDALHSAAVPVLSVALQKDKITGHHKGFGNIWFNNSRSASDALDSLQNFTIDGASLLFEPFQPLMGERTSKLVPDGRSIYVGNLPLDASKEEILEFCRDAGLTNVFGIRQPKGPSRGFVHIDFSNSSEAKTAQLALSEKTLRGRRLIVGDSRLRHDVGVGEVKQERFEIFVGNVSTKITQEYFKGFLDEVLGKEKYRSVSLGRHRVTGNPDFYAFVDCGSEENRQAALRKLKGLKLIDRVVRPELPRPPRPVFHSW